MSQGAHYWRHFGRAILGNRALFLVWPVLALPRPSEGTGIDTCPVVWTVFERTDGHVYEHGYRHAL